MRSLSWSCCLVLATVACIDDSMVDSLARPGCPAGQEPCGASCAPLGTCFLAGGASGAGGVHGTGASAGTAGTAGAAGSSTAGGGEATAGAGTAGAAGSGTGSGGQATAGAGSEDCSDTATATGSFAVQYDAVEIPVVGGGKSYFLQTNWWFLYGGQTVSYDGLSFTVGNPEDTAVGATDPNPTGFPSLFIGSYSGNTTVGSNLPMQVSAITSVPTVFSTNSFGLDASNFNAAYDVWFTAGGAPLPRNRYSPGNGGAYLMVWLFKPANRQPRGSIAAPAQTVDGVPGTWDVWVDPTTNSPPCVSYVSAIPRDSLSFDLNRFIRDAVTNQYGITDSMYLSIVFAGFEIWGGGDGLQAKQFCVKVN